MGVAMGRSNCVTFDANGAAAGGTGKASLAPTNLPYAILRPDQSAAIYETEVPDFT